MKLTKLEMTVLRRIANGECPWPSGNVANVTRAVSAALTRLKGKEAIRGMPYDVDCITDAGRAALESSK